MTRRGLFPSLRRALLGALVWGATACATVHPYYNYATEPDPRKQEFVLGPADVVRISVWKNAELSTDAIVRPDAMITLPLVGDLRAGGRTTQELRAEISQKLSAYLKDESATVTVSLQAINSYRFAVLGNAEHAGTFVATHFLTVTEAMALAGGPSRFADPEQMVIIRTDARRGTRRIPIDYSSILNGTHPEQDLPLLSGDIIYLP